MPYFIISPSEAFLIGCCVGEYREARRDNEYADFPHFLIKRLRPFVPDMTVTTASVPLDEVPNGLSWEEYEDFAIAVDDDAVYRRCLDQVTRVKWDRSRKSLVDLLAELIRPFCKWSPNARIALPLPGDEVEGQRLLVLFQYALSLCEVLNERNIESVWHSPVSPDNEDSLTREIDALVRDRANDLYDTYRDGQMYGRWMASIERHKVDYLTGFNLHEVEPSGFDFRHGELMWQPRPDAEWEQEYQSTLADVAKCKSSAGLSHVVTTCQREVKRGVRSTYGDLTMGYACDVAPRETAFWLCVGMVLGSFRDADNEAHRKNAQSAVPRMFMLGPNAPIERVQGQVYMLEQILDERLGVSFAPADIIRFSANVVEALSKSLWPREFDQPKEEGKTPNVLRRRGRVGTELERRFAQIALLLYQNYRCKAVHEDFACSWTEARFFYGGIRTLTELRDEIVKERGTA